MKKWVLIITFFSSISFTTTPTFSQDSLTIIIPSVGFGNIRLGKTSIKKIKKIYGSDYQIDTNYCRIISNPIDLDTIIPYKSVYSIMVSYPKHGITFYFDSTFKKLFSIHVYHPFKTITDQGIILNESTFRDVEKIYGTVSRTFSSEKMHKHYQGIVFHREFYDELPITALELQPYLDQKVTRISIETKR